tara:strand:- start:100 stop:423 length:324 start_codon:yes stop_codon:yes gene_type:complete
MKITKSQLKQIIKEELEKVLSEDDREYKFKKGDKVTPTETWRRKRVGTVVKLPEDYGYLNQGQFGVQYVDIENAKPRDINPTTGKPYIHQYLPDQLELYDETPEGEI